MLDSKDIALYNALRKKYIEKWSFSFVITAIAVVLAYVLHIENTAARIMLASALGFTALTTAVVFIKYPKASLEHQI